MKMSAVSAKWSISIRQDLIRGSIFTYRQSSNSNAIESKDKMKSQKLYSQFFLTVHVIVSLNAHTICLSPVNFSRLVSAVSDITTISS
jgi:hypothetical protein